MIQFPGYEVREVLDRGPRSTVYRGVRSRDGQSVILKYLTASAPTTRDLGRYRFAYELTRDLELPGICPTYDLLEHEGRPLMVTQDIGGHSIRELLKRSALDIESVLRIGVAVSSALSRLHLRRVVHRDVNPSNIVYNPHQTHVQLIDFDLASKLLSTTTELVNPGGLEGTLAYISPEQTGRMNRAVDHRTDLYSLGVTLYEMLRGELPFLQKEPMALVHAHMAVTPPALTGVPQQLVDVVMKLMEKNPEDRYQSASGVKSDLARCLQAVEAGQPIAAFPLGLRDVSPELKLSEHLYGREAEVNALMESFERAAYGRSPGDLADTGHVELLLVAGYSGVGKSSLVHEIHKPVTASRGRFAAGKFDQLNRAPYGALVEIVAELVDDVLKDSAEDVERIAARVRAAVGKDGGVITEITNAVELLLGPQDTPAPLPATEARARFQRVFQRFLHAFADADSPLVLFLDDLQWADPSSLSLIQRLVGDPIGGHMLLLGAYRDNEVNPEHDLTRTVVALERMGATVTTLALKPLARLSVTRWLADSFHQTTDEVGPLAKLVHQKTRGNPFFVARFVMLLGEEGLLRFDEDGGRWQWRLEDIAALGISENVAELMGRRIGRLPPDCQAAIEVAACVGNRIQLGTLAHALGQDAEEVAQALWPALGAGLLDPIGDAYRLVGLLDDTPEDITYRFVHDRVQEAAYAAIPDDRRASTHLKIGRRLLAHSSDSPEPDGIFGIVDQLNAGAGLIVEVTERRRLADLNLLAGRRASASVAYDAARRYLQAGVDILSGEGWDAHYETSFELHRALAQACDSGGAYDVALTVLHAALGEARTDADKVNLLTAESELHARTGEHQRLMEVGLSALALLGFDIPGAPEAWAARGEGEAQKLTEAMAGRNPTALLELPEMTDETARLATDVLAVLSPVIWANLHTVPVINPWLIRTYATYGHTSASAAAYAGYAMQLSAFGQYAAADGFGQLAAALADKRNELSNWPSVGFVNANWVAHWTHPLEEAIAHGKKSISAALETGAGTNWAAWTTMVLPGLRMEGVGDLEDAIEETRHYYRVGGNRFNVADCLTIGRGALLPMYRLVGDRDAVTAQFIDGYDETSIHKSLEHYPLIRGPLYTWRMIADYILGDYRAALKGYEQASETITHGPGLVSFLQWRYFSCLAMLASWDSADEETRAAWTAHLDASMPMLENWAALNPSVHGSKPLLVAAERASVEGRLDEAADGYEAAIARAEDGGTHREIALALERAGRFWIRSGNARRSLGYLRDSRYAWVRWGASAKVESMDAEFPILGPMMAHHRDRTRSATRTNSNQIFDNETLLQATRAISTELVLDDLLNTLLEKVIENAGAQRVCLMMPDRGPGLKIRAQASVPGVESEGLAWTVVRYVARSKSRVVLSDAVASERFGNDPYVRSARPRSVLCQPVINQGALVGVLYLENNLTSEAFTPQRCEVLDVLSSQAAISIQNARLFDEQKALTRSMARFLPSEFLGLLGRESVVDVELGEATEQDMTVLFSDIRGFTSRSEAMSPPEIFAFLNTYLRHAGPVIRRHGGFIDKYIGDEIMALFPDAPSAVRAGVDLMHALRAFNAELETQGAEPMRIGVGLHHGRLMLGTIGEPERMDGTVISDTVNVASRLQGMTKILLAPIIASEAVLEQLDDNVGLPCRYMGEVLLRGRQQPLAIFELFAAEDDQTRKARLATRDDFEAGIRALGAHHGGAAIAAFERVLAVDPSDAAAGYHLGLARGEVPGQGD